MIQILYTPKWFNGHDILIEMIGVFVLLLISFFSYKYYKLNKSKNNLYFSISFLLMSIGLMFKILSNFSIYYITSEVANIGFVEITYQSLTSVNTLFFIGFFLYRLITLLGLYLLYLIYSEKESTSTKILILFLLISSTYFTQAMYYVFHMTCLILLLLITNRYYLNYLKNKIFSAKLLFISFLMITLSHLLFIFVLPFPLIYVFAELIHLFGFIGLLMTFILVVKNGKKKG